MSAKTRILVVDDEEVVRDSLRAWLEKDGHRVEVAPDGVKDRQLILAEMLPNVLPVVLVLLPLMIATNIVTEAALSYLSIGVQAPNASWGTIVQDGQNLLYTRPWVSVAPGVLIAITVLALNVLGDGVRDALDPRGSLRIRRRTRRMS
jgi:peptide/nickel transport system permease protein